MPSAVADDREADRHRDRGERERIDQGRQRGERSSVDEIGAADRHRREGRSEEGSRDRQQSDLSALELGAVPEPDDLPETTAATAHPNARDERDHAEPPTLAECG